MSNFQTLLWWFTFGSRASEMGITMLKPQSTGRAHISHLESLTTTLNLILNAIPQFEKDTGSYCQLIIVVVDGKRSPLYNEIKYFADIEKGVIVQVVNYYPVQQSESPVQTVVQIKPHLTESALKGIFSPWNSIFCC